MGQSQNKDPNIQIYINTEKDVHVSGEELLGFVYLNVLADSSYMALHIALKLNQQVYWTTGSGKNRKVHSNQRSIYQSECEICNFDGQLKKGQYQFPFSLIIPYKMSGTFKLRSSNQIQAFIQARLVSQSKILSQKHFLTILEPPRMEQQPLFARSSVFSSCCHCLIHYGRVAASLEVNKVFAIGGQEIEICGKIDNSQNKVDTRSYEIVLKQNIFRISKRKVKKVDRLKLWTISQSEQPIEAGKIKKFTIRYNIPDNIEHCSAIGNIIGCFYTIELNVNYGCCAETPNPIIHILINPSKIKKAQNMAKPILPSWNPETFALTQCQMQPWYRSNEECYYIYKKTRIQNVGKDNSKSQQGQLNSPRHLKQY